VVFLNPHEQIPSYQFKKATFPNKSFRIHQSAICLQSTQSDTTAYFTYAQSLHFTSIIVKYSKFLINFYKYSLIILKKEIQLPFYGIRYPCGKRYEIDYGNLSGLRLSSWRRMVYPPAQGDGQGKLIGWKCGEL